MFSILLLFVWFANVCSQCPDSWSQYKDSCYLASGSTAYSWSNAQQKCKTLNGYLAEIQNQDENNFIARMTFGQGTWFFMGIVFDKSSERWVKARNQEEVDYSNWLEAESNKVSIPGCTKLGYLGYWESFPCDEQQYFICESDNYISSSSFGRWLSHTNSYRYGGHYYRTVGKRATFDEAKSMCEKAGSYLFEPDSEGENEFVHDKMHEAFFGRWRFIGGNDKYQEGHWIWGNRKSSVNFRNWWPGEPNNKYGEDCMEMRYWGKWNDVDCDHNNRYICEKSVDVISTVEVASTTTEGPDC